jgi:transposase-like protein
MFDDETLDVACPKCGHSNPIPVREFEESSEAHFICKSCKVGFKVEAKEFRDRLGQIRKELDELEHDAAREAKRKPSRPRKGNFQI